MSYDDNDHARHGHLDGGRCLDGSGRTWQPLPMTDEERATLLDRWKQARNDAPVVVLAPNRTERRIERLAQQVMLLTIAVVLLAVGAVVHIAAEVLR